VAVVDPGLLFGWACKSELARHGVAVGGTVKRQRVRAADGSLSGQVQLVAVEQTALPDLIHRCNKRSQNLFAECLLKMIGLRVKGAGSWQAGCQAVGEFLAGIGLPAQSYRLDDGSGLSRQNRFSARALTQLLLWARRHPHGQSLVDSLPVWGVDGSLRGRLDDPALRGRVRAKTGSLAGVSALSGYAEGQDGRVVVFSMLFNDVGKHGSLVQTAQRQVAQALVRLTREPVAASKAAP
jgi:D-alanyl-D-alanine carboxypeptidase/D-alanyl-D-alanine-endopeptidase (penicillin-binding protein 4)